MYGGFTEWLIDSNSDVKIVNLSESWSPVDDIFISVVGDNSEFVFRNEVFLETRINVTLVLYGENNKVIIDMENLSGWNVEIIFGDFCRDNEVDIINVKDDRNVIADYYLSENSVRVENIVKVNGIRKL